MKIYNVLFESDHENEDVHSFISSFTKRTDAVMLIETALDEELKDGGYEDEDIKKLLVRDGDDFFCIYHDESHSNWRFRGTIYETELV